LLKDLSNNYWVFKLIQSLYHIPNKLFTKHLSHSVKASLQLAKKIPSLTSPSSSVIITTCNTAKLFAFLYRDIGNIGLPAALAACANHGFYGIPAL